MAHTLKFTFKSASIITLVVRQKITTSLNRSKLPTKVSRRLGFEPYIYHMFSTFVPEIPKNRNTETDKTNTYSNVMPIYFSVFSNNVINFASLKEDMKVIDNFITEDEEKSLLDEIEPYIKRIRYQYDHWDDAIHGYRETEKLQWKDANNVILQRLRKLAFDSKSIQLHHVHVLDLAENGFIKPHIDSERFCGNVIAGISLLSSSVMRLIPNADKSSYIDILLKQRSLYIMRDSARYNFTHEILESSKSIFKDEVIKRERRISVICRNEPEVK